MISRTQSTFGLYPTPAAATEAAIAYWSGAFKTATDIATWWTRAWLRGPDLLAAFTPATAFGAAFKAPTPAEAVADAKLAVREAEALAVEATAASVEVAEDLSEIPETIAEHAIAVAKIEVAPVVEAAADDLTRLVGVGPKLAQSLSARGVTRFAQIAAWTKKDLEDVDKSLKLLGRAERDAWIAQAKRFAAET